MQGKIFELPEFQKLAKKYDKSIAQIVLRYDLQKGVITIPKSAKSNALSPTLIYLILNYLNRI